MLRVYLIKKFKASILTVLVFVFYITPFSLRAQCDSYVTPYICTGSGSTNCAAYPTNALLLEGASNQTLTFDNITSYNSGMTLTGATVLHVKVNTGTAACKWSLAVMVSNGGAPTNPATWQQLTAYGASPLPLPQISSLKFRVYNSCNTPNCPDTWQDLTINGQGLYIIKDIAGLPISGCQSNVDALGSYLTDYNAYTFTIDYMITPGFSMPPGSYQLSLQFCLVEDD